MSSNRKPKRESSRAASNQQTEVDDSYAWFQHLDWWGQLSPTEIRDRLLRVTFEYNEGWAVVPIGFVRERFDAERALGEAEDRLKELDLENVGWCGAWYQMPGWWGDDAPSVVASRVQAAAEETGEGSWVLVPQGYLTKYHAPANEEIAPAPPPVPPIPVSAEQRAIARDILLDLVRTKGPSSEWPRVAWEMARKFAEIESEGQKR